MKQLLLLLAITFSFQATAQEIIQTEQGVLKIYPIQHATLVMEWNDKTIYFDPYGGAEAFQNFNKPDLIFITDIHGDHLNKKTLQALETSQAIFVVPSAVADQMQDIDNSSIEVINNGESNQIMNIQIETIPMYNLPESPDNRHTKGRGNGYVLTIGGKRIYISGDTEAIPEMRTLKNIDVAFVCMNLPYTMDVDQAADGVLDFAPKVVYPYHYRGKGGLSDIDKFKALVNEKNTDIDVRLRNWYPAN
ncbi:MBL fold metallo-hydrolase [Marivirga atlantica]|jgi:L-ascorbate metabolism protein UlaG (beta-lactamase superfamily)|uniref:MBL fold metallo-hydrolase n=1 Tax=Marivirga atlantica TaxID=1548457 RepID=A0A937AFJ4_9BACT|nr:MBL fold metallo-hydrolase [Marivirga atlantica]MBL0765569.1 MBL fold metallo-hydrolase [Marivirga atlantica]